MPLKTNEEVRSANSVNLPDFLTAQGENLVRSGKGYRLKEHNSLFIQENRWYWNSRSKGGNNIKFVMEYYNKTFPEAVDMLNGGRIFNRDVAYHNEIKPPTEPEHIKNEIKINEAPNCKRAIAYLTKTRELDYNIVIDLVRQKKITQDLKGNAVFMAKDENGMTVGAELVGTSSEHRFKGVATGSSYGYGFEVCKGNPEHALFFESPIDLLSYLQTYQNELDNHLLVSMTGLKPGTVEETIKRYNISDNHTFLCVDNDNAGNEFVERLKQKHPEMHRIKTINGYKDWNEQLKAKITGKQLDFTDLMCYTDKGENDMDVKAVKTTYTDSIQKITASAEEWEKYLRFSAHLDISEQQQKHNFSSKLLIYSVNPNVTDCKTFKEWKSENNRVAFGSKGIPVLSDNEKGEPVVTHVFDISQTSDHENRSQKVITTENRNSVEEALVNAYGTTDVALENLIATIIADEVGNFDISDNKKEFLAASICFEVFEKFGLDLEYDYEMFSGVTEFSIRDIAELGVAMNQIAVSLENTIENAITEAERSMENAELHEQRWDRVHMERGSETALPDVSAGEQPVVQTGHGNMDLHSNDEVGNTTGGIGQVWSNEVEVPRTEQDSGMAQSDMGEQTVQSLHTGERTDTRTDREYDISENPVGGIQESGLSDNGSAPQPVSERSGRNDTSDDDLRLNQNINITQAAVEDSSAAAFSVQYEKLTDLLLSDSSVINASQNSDKENLITEISAKITPYAVQILNEDIMSNVGFYNDIMNNQKSRTDFIEALADKSLTAIAEKSAAIDTGNPEPTEKETSAENRDINSPIPEKNVSSNEKTPKQPVDTQKRSKNGDIILGNTPFRYIPQKTFVKVDKDMASDISDELNRIGVKFSGVIKGETATFTVSRPDKQNLESIIEALTPAEPHQNEIAAETEPITAEPLDLEFEQTSILAETEHEEAEPIAETVHMPVDNDVEHNMYSKFAELFPDIISGEHKYEHYESPTHEPLSIDKIGENTYSVMQSYTQNGDIMYDPDVVIQVDTDNQTIHAVSYEQSGLGVYQEFEPGTAAQKDCHKFVEQWLNDMDGMNFELTKTISVHEFQDRKYDITAKIENGTTEYDGNEQAVADYMKTHGIEKDEKSEDKAEISGGSIKKGDMFNYQNTEYTVTSLLGIYPNEIGITCTETLSNGMSYNCTKNIDRDKLASEGEYLGNIDDMELVSNEPVVSEENFADSNAVKSFEIYQLKDDEDLDNYRFASLGRLERHDMSVNKENYELIYSGEISSKTTLDDFFSDFNNNIPDDFNGHSISTSDVIVIDDNGDISAYYVDRHGFEEIPEFLAETTMEKNMALAETLQTGDYIRTDNSIWQITSADDFIMKIENTDKSANNSVRMFVGNWQEQLAAQGFEKLSTSEVLNTLSEDVIVPKSHSKAVIDDDDQLDIFNDIPVEPTPVPSSVEKPVDAEQTTSETVSDVSSERSETEKSAAINTNTELSYVTDIEANHSETDKGSLTAPEPVNDTDTADKEKATEKEIASPYFHIKDEHLGEGGAKTKFRNNIEAIKTLKAIENEERTATPEEKEIMSKYVGWGGLSMAFDLSKDDWLSEATELITTLSNAEYTAARMSTLDAFYTSPIITEAMYSTLERIGFNGGDILEPSMGIGNFFGTMPDSIRKESSLMGVELDDISGRIARQLYPEADISINGFEKMKFANNQFDLAVGNVPFGDISFKYNKQTNLKIHDFFFMKSVDKVRPGGIVAFITSSGTMDKQDNKVRKMLAQKCELLGAVRLPGGSDGAFKKNAGTEVTSDIIFLKKREKPINESEITDSWVNIGKSENGLPVNQYFAENPQMVLGTLEKSSFRDTIVCKASSDTDLKEALNNALSNINGKYEAIEFQPELNEKSDVLQATPDIQNYTYTVVDEKLYFRRDDDLIPLKDSEQTGIKAERRKGMCQIADTVKELLNAQVENQSDDVIEKLQKQLSFQYDTYTKKYGRFNKIGNSNPNSLFRNDVRFPLLQSLEKIENDRFVGKASIFTERTITPHKTIEHADTSSEALILSVSEKAKVDLDYMSELTGFDKNKLISDLHGVIYPVPELSDKDNVVYQTAEEYLSGNIYEKLQTAEKAAKENPIFAPNINALETAKPVPLTAAEIVIKLGETWLDPKIIEQFMYETFDTPNRNQAYNVPYQKNKIGIEVSYSSSGKGEWHISNKNFNNDNVKVSTTYGTPDKNAYQLLEDVLNLRSPKINVYDEVIGESGHREKILNRPKTAKATEMVNQKIQMIKNAFSEWIFKDPERREKLVNQYNELYNCIKPREYDGSHLNFVGMNPEIKLREHQTNAIAHALFGGNSLFAHEVGAGKTFEMIATAMEGKRLGLHNKSMFVVPNHLTEQIAGDFMKLYPNANILVAKPEDFTAHNRRKMCSKIATGNFDAVIIGHSQLIKIPVSPEREQKFIRNQIKEITSSIEAAKAHDGKNFTVKQLEKTKRSLNEKLEKLVNSTVKDQTVTFEELGIDKLFVDEAHLFKNLFISTKLSNISGISTNDNVQKTQDLYLKCQYLDEKTDGRGITFATGTPVSNSMTEIYSMMKYLQSEDLEKLGLKNFDSWAAKFGDTVTAGELAPDGSSYRMKTRFAKFENVPELMAIFKQCADIKTADVLNLDVPECEKKNICVEPSEKQAELVKSLSERAEMVQNGMVDPRDDNMLTITNDGRKIGLDARLINPMLPDNPNSKINACVDNVFSIWENTADKRSTQLIFCDLGVPQSKEDLKKNGKRFSVYDDIKEKLISRGVPENEIAFIHDVGDNEIKKAQLFAKVRNGDVRVLIGSTAKMGAGTNVQNKLIASHDLDCPWKPADMTQRAGRMIRQGNENKNVQLFRYVTQNTFDAYLFQTLEKKQNFISQIMTSKAPARVCEDVDEQALDYAEIKALCAGDPRIKERMELDVDVSKLKMLKSGFMTQKYALEDNVLKILPQRIAAIKNTISGLKADIKTASDYVVPRDLNGDEQFRVKLDGIIYDDKAEAGKALAEISTKAVMGNTDKNIPVGEYKGFPLEISFDSLTKQFKAHLKGSLSHTTDVISTQPGRTFGKLDNIINSLTDRLANSENMLEVTKENLSKSKLELDKPFPYENELKEKEARLIEITADLEANPKKEKEEKTAEAEKEVSENTVSDTPQKSDDEPKSSDNSNSSSKSEESKEQAEVPTPTVPVQTEAPTTQEAPKPIIKPKEEQKSNSGFLFSLASLKDPKYAPSSQKQAPQPEKTQENIH